MRHTLVSGLLLLCVHFYFVTTGSLSSNHNLSRRESPKQNFSSSMVVKMKVTPTWYLNAGDNVEFNCTAVPVSRNNTDNMDVQLVWTKMGPGERIKKVLVSKQASEDISFVLGHITREHQGLYSCEVNGTPSDVFVLKSHFMIWVAEPSPRATIDMISPNRNQFLHGEKFTMSCQLPDNNTQWKMMRFDSWVGSITECPDQVSSDHRLSCTSQSQYPWSDKLYWCESSAGETSNPINITSSVSTTMVLESPPLPVLEGENVMLRCLVKNTTTNEMMRHSAHFYKNDIFIRYAVDGTWTLPAVTKADEGFYQCKPLRMSLSHASWISVKARPDEDQNKRSDIKTSLATP